jgi:hypothetical protein
MQSQQSFARRASWLAMVAAFALIVAGDAGAGQGGPHGRMGQGHMGPGGMRGGPGQMADMGLIHELLDNGDKVRRTVTLRDDGVETLTESDDPAFVTKIRAHVGAMYARIDEGRPIHMRDPLFREIFANVSRIEMKHEATEKGVRVIETSSDPYVVKLIQAHAEVVSRFIRNGRAEAMQNHDVPAR